MVISSIRPSTVDGIKQLAKKIKRERSITHTTALDVASRQAGFENFVHARRQLGARKPVFSVYLSIHWYVPRNSVPVTGIRGGLEVLEVSLSRPLPDLVAKHRVSSGRGLAAFRMEYRDHLEYETNAQSKEDAQNRLLTAERGLRFIEATGLQPVTTQKHRDAARYLDDLPGRDHVSQWFDPESDAVVLLDEPYKRAIEDRQGERREWVKARGAHMLSPAWEGIYRPGNCPPHLISSDEKLLERLSASLARLAPQAVSADWKLPSRIYGEDFISPARIADMKPRKARPGPSYRDYMGARPFGGAPGIRSRWRPVQTLPIDQHVELGKLLQTLIHGRWSNRVRDKLDHHRSELEDWMFSEHGSSPPDDVYYGRDHETYVDANERRTALAKAKKIVERGYNECKPRRLLMAALDAALDEISAAPEH